MLDVCLIPAKMLLVCGPLELFPWFVLSCWPWVIHQCGWMREVPVHCEASVTHQGSLFGNLLDPGVTGSTVFCLTVV